jgi:hypothetical protein
VGPITGSEGQIRGGIQQLVSFQQSRLKRDNALKVLIDTGYFETSRDTPARVPKSFRIDTEIRLNMLILQCLQSFGF